jgi:hypothetical protein
MVLASLTVHVTAVSTPSSLKVNARLFPVPGAAVSFTLKAWVAQFRLMRVS